MAARQRRCHPAAAVRGGCRRGARPGDRQALEISGADLVVLALPAGDGRQLVIEHAAGDGAKEAIGLVLPVASSVSGIVLGSGKPLSLDDFSSDERAAPAAREHLHLGPGGGGPARRARQRPRDPDRRAPPGLDAAGPARGGDADQFRRAGGRRRWSWPSTAGTPSASPCSRTATGSPVTCMTWSSSGCMPPACRCRACPRGMGESDERAAHQQRRRRPRRDHQGDPVRDLLAALAARRETRPACGPGSWRWSRRRPPRSASRPRCGCPAAWTMRARRGGRAPARRAAGGAVQRGAARERQQGRRDHRGGPAADPAGPGQRHRHEAGRAPERPGQPGRAGRAAGRVAAHRGRRWRWHRARVAGAAAGPRCHNGVYALLADGSTIEIRPPRLAISTPCWRCIAPCRRTTSTCVSSA